MANRADLSRVEMAYLGTASIFVGFLLLGKHRQNPSPCQWRTCAADAGPGDQRLPPNSTVFMLMISYCFAVLSWCFLAMLGRPQQHHSTEDLARTVSEISLGFATVAGIAAVDTMIGLGHFSGSRLQMAGGGWTCLVVIVAAYTAAVCKLWKATRLPATSNTSTPQVLSVDITPRTTVLPADRPAAAGHTYAGPGCSSRSVSLGPANCR